MDLEFSAIRISDSDWPTAPGQGAISVHCRTEEYEKLSEIREILNHEETEIDVNMEREILQSIGGGCLYPAGIKVRDGYANVQISPMNWKEIFSRGLPFQVQSIMENYPNLNQSYQIPKFWIINQKIMAQN